MATGTVNAREPISARAVCLQYYRDAARLLLQPGSFFEALPVERDRRDALLFLALTAVIYSLAATVFTTVQRPLFMALYLINALLMPVITALVMHLLLGLLCPGRYSYDLLLRVVAYANVALLLGWIPGLAPWTEILKYFLIGLGLVKTGRISGLKAFGAILSTAFLLVMMVYLFQFLMRS